MLARAYAVIVVEDCILVLHSSPLYYNYTHSASSKHAALKNKHTTLLPAMLSRNLLLLAVLYKPVRC